MSSSQVSQVEFQVNPGSQLSILKSHSHSSLFCSLHSFHLSHAHTYKICSHSSEKVISFVDISSQFLKVIQLDTHFEGSSHIYWA